MPQNAGGTPIDPTEINQSDGFSPGAPILVRVPGMDTPQAFAATAPSPVTDMDESFAADAKVVVIDADHRRAAADLDRARLERDHTGTRPHCSIHPAKNLTDGHRYIVALRGLKDAAGATLEARRPGSASIRDGIPTDNPAIESRRDHFEQGVRLRSRGPAIEPRSTSTSPGTSPWRAPRTSLGRDARASGTTPSRSSATPT